MRRTEAREALMQLFYECEAKKAFTEEVKEDFELNFEITADQKPYFNHVWSAYVQNRDAVDGMIEAYSNGWKKNRIAKVDLAVLRLCISELKFAEKEEIPESVSINEAVNLAKKYSDEQSGKFVNGILGRIARGEAPQSEAEAEK